MALSQLCICIHVAIVEKVRRRSSIPFRPKVALEGKEVYVNIMRVCWNDKPSERPTFPRIHAMLHKANDRFALLNFIVSNKKP